MTNPISGRGRGQGKTILFGEHAVVYGCPALACALDRGAVATVTAAEHRPLRISHPHGVIDDSPELQTALDALFAVFDARADQWSIDITIDIPVGVGLGSSAAMAVAVARALADAMDLDGEDTSQRIARAAAASEAAVHGTPSGIDQTAAMGEGLFLFQRPADGEAPRITPLKSAPSSWVIARVAPPSSTANMVAGVAALHHAQPQLCDKLFEAIADLTHRGARALTDHRLDEVGQLMNLNQGLLNALGTSTPRLEEACQRARDAGALGAKLTGAGGGGCIIALAAPDHISSIVQALEPMGDVFNAGLPPGQERP